MSTCQNPSKPPRRDAQENNSDYTKVKMSDASAASRAASSLEAAGTNSSSGDPIQAWDSLDSAPEEHHYENGRRYHMYNKGRYPLPNDEDEQSREIMKHYMMLELAGGKLFYAPIGDTPERILDIGTGVGAWAIDVADEYPGSEVLGTDLSAMQPDLVPPNARFLVDDVEDPEWLNGSGWDLIHLRFVVGMLRDVPGTMARCFENTKPGGWIEIQDTHFIPKCDDGTMKDDDHLYSFLDLVHRAFAKGGMDLHCQRNMGQHLTEAGYTGVRCVAKKTPVGPWARGEHLQRIGETMKHVIYDVLPSFAKPLELLDMSRVEAELWFVKVRKTLEDRSRHRYVNTYFWYAQKPGGG
ncbi:hypothetical protein GGTG_00373 [Gaeumannomyces tritici R3-111a-1]|uniref:Methyltransferase n=1 Tax=Gaeumannomyces tritici (strain R3-111a-1) TaxID=644352 RepID=J3NGI3_GAET3|nr:hypothetical protein GGTG_00373 [Gaeumannomyces tritici R3-111a-1]EJT80373.1 hypothetical protein GGTG_00373 [Gaeumannomyces tritici R3-111a-1]